MDRTKGEFYLTLSEEQKEILERKHIYITFAYTDLVRIYKHNVLIWEASGSENERLSKLKECIKFFF